MKKIKIAIVLIILISITTLYSYFYSIPTYDSIWNYGFAYNITKGLIPYKDYNMIITPLFPYLLSLFIIIFGHKLIIYHILTSTLIVLTGYISYKKIGYKSIVISILMLTVNDLGYNILIIFLFILLLYLIDKDKPNDILIAIIISLMILTKQTLGILIIPSIIFSKNKKKTIIVYIITILLSLIYFIYNNNLYQFMDYCFFGMLDFTSRNKTKFTIITIIEIISCIFILYKIIKTKNKSLIYILFFQIMAFPITDGPHFLISFIPVLYYILSTNNKKIANYIIYVIVINFFITYLVLQTDFKLINYYNKKTSFMYKARTPNYFYNYFKYIEQQRKNYKGYRIYLLDSRAYLVKLELGWKINKYDLINNGNMGYKGSEKYIKEIDKYCKKHKCVFMLNESDNNKEVGQTNKEIINYVIKEYRQVSSSNLDNIYTNQ